MSRVLDAAAHGRQLVGCPPLVIMKLLIVLPCVLVAVRTGRPAGAGASLLVSGFALAAADITANLALGHASRTGSLPLVSVLASMYPIATLLLARWILRERLGT
jgi:drug/metabolite transporter (DMT)-like permease